ncbi:MAG: DUF2975 domain-containing protein [Clostridia bacterium]|nr:DUF2975 domain-containing protein [Clostridia bacterium]
MKNKESKMRASYGAVRILTKIGSPLFMALGGFFAFAAVLILIMIPIIFLVNVPVEEMLLPPYMDTVRENGAIIGYDIIIGGGVKFSVPADTVTLGDIKAAVYSVCLLGTFAALELTAVFVLLSRLFGNIKKNGPLNKRNADMICFIGITVIVSEFVVSAVYRFLNYTLVKTFSPEAETVKYVFGVSWTPILLGILILLIGTVFGYAAGTAAVTDGTPALPVEAEGTEE